MQKRVFLVGILGAIGLVFTSGAQADTIGSLTLTNCGSGGTGCPGATYSYNITNTSASLTINITGPVTLSNDYITAVDLGFTSSSNNLPGLTLSVAPSSGWTGALGSLSSGGTCGVNNGGFVCASATPLNSLMISQGGSYTWTWTYNELSSIFADGVHIGAEYGPNQGNYKGLIVSQTTAAAVPEPSTLVLFGAGAMALAIGFALKKALA